MRFAAVLVIGALLARGQINPAARQAELSGDFAGAEKAYEQDLQTHPTAATWQRLGLVRNLQSKFEAAIPAFREALRLDPSLWTSRLFLGICLYRTNDFAGARSEFERASAQAPPDNAGRDEIDYWLGATLIAARQLLPGLIRLERLLARKPGRVDALQLATETYAALGSNIWNEIAEQNFDSPQGWEIHGHALESEGDISGAIEAYRHSRSLNRNRLGPGTAIGRLLLRQGKTAEARAELDAELKQHPDCGQAWYFGGLAAVQEGRNKEAAPLLEKAVQLQPRDPEPAIALAQVYLGLGDRARAAEAARKALAVAPGNIVATELIKAAEQH